jgi:cellulose 1,4-beta-cellobiosidase
MNTIGLIMKHILISALCCLLSALPLMAYPESQPPPPPINVQAAPGNGQVTIKWTTGSTNPANPTDSFVIYWAHSAGVTPASPNKKTALMGPATVTGLSNGTLYYFIVTGVNKAGESSPSITVSATPGSAVVLVPPKNVHATAENKSVRVEWDSEPTAESYNLYYRPTMPGVTKANGTKVSTNLLVRNIIGLTNGTCYYIILTSVNGSNESAASHEVCVTPVAP